MITVIGSINLDLIATVDRLPGAGETVAGDTFTTAAGGKGANQALAAARAGAEVRLIGAVGKDAFAVEALECIRDEAIDLTGVLEAHSATGTALILVNPTGDNVIAVVPGANAAVLPGDVQKAHLAQGDVLLLQQEIPHSTVEAALTAAAQAGARSILNAAPVRPDKAATLAKADFVVVNETEFDLYADALGLAGSDRAARGQEFVARTGKTVIVTLGGDGVIAISPAGLLRVAALAIEPVDTVGAGDTFCGYFGAGLATGLGLEDALRRAAIAGSLACLKPGAQPAVPHAADVDRALAEGASSAVPG